MTDEPTRVPSIQIAAMKWNTGPAGELYASDGLGGEWLIAHSGGRSTAKHRHGTATVETIAAEIPAEDMTKLVQRLRNDRIRVLIATAAAALDDPYAALSQHLHGDGDSAWRTRALAAEAEIERLRADRGGRPPLTSDELAEFRRNHPLDGLARVALAAWVNVRPDQLPPAMQAHNCPATMTAWARVADAISRALIDATPDFGDNT